MDHGSLASPEFMVLVHDIVDAVKHYMAGIPITQETLALDVIHRVGPGGHYLQDPHTMQHFKKIKYSDLFERMMTDKYESTGAKRFEQRLQELTLKKLEHKPAPLAAETLKILDEMQSSWK
jgi:trimethylamine--corrinoid protein Co-methyltransferase